ncbi:hypothetical protein [Arenibaculum pallidiluteum]|uniref:hypothetical protein n=1 Tax=Arenibaculum pallidiluteum TaxID=2812559 RepID=UPI001A96AC4F|nr:hypothetical protein [Arenibaculum pallidiluteum]
MDMDLNLLAQNGIVTGADFDPALLAALSGKAAPAPWEAPVPAASRAEEATVDGLDPQLAAYWMWNYGATAPAIAAAAVVTEYVATVSGRCGRDFIDGTDYLTEIQLRDYLTRDVANENWLLRRVK